jgi:hypothetical protein
MLVRDPGGGGESIVARWGSRLPEDLARVKRVFYLRIGFSAAAMRWKSSNLRALPGSVLIAFAACIALGSSVAHAAAERLEASRHPQDGPHVDLRFALTADAVVAEVSMNLVFLDEILTHPREESDRLALSELRVMEPAILTRMAELCQVRADGRPLQPTLDGLAMNDPDEALLPLFPISGMRGLRKIRFELRFPLAEAASEPTSLSFVWLAFPVDLLSMYEPKPKLVIAAELVAQGVRHDLIFLESEPEQMWHAERGGVEGRLAAVPRPAAPPTLGIAPVGVIAGIAAGVFVWGAARGTRGRGTGRGAALRGIVVGMIVGAPAALLLRSGRVAIPMPLASRAALPTVDEAAAIFDPLHANLYRAFDYVDESAIYDALALSVDGPLLEELYLTIHRSLVMAEEGGALSRVVAVRRSEVLVESVGLLEATDPSDSVGGVLAEGTDAEAAPSFLVRCRFEVDGRVTHWGHAHERTNGYVARYTVVARGDGWRIADVEVLEQTRLDAAEEGPPPAIRPGADGLLDL